MRKLILRSVLLACSVGAIPAAECAELARSSVVGRDVLTEAPRGAAVSDTRIFAVGEQRAVRSRIRLVEPRATGRMRTLNAAKWLSGVGFQAPLWRRT